MTKYIPLSINKKILQSSKAALAVIFLCCTLFSYGQLVPNQYTPITSANNLVTSLSASDECNIGDLSCVDNLSDVDGNLGDAATINVLASSEWIEVGFNETAPAGSYAGFVIESGISLVAGLSITVSDGINSETISGTNLLTLGLTGSTDKIGFFPTIAFDSIRITFGGVSGSLDVYYAEVMKFEAADALTCNTATVMNRPEYPLTVTTSVSGVGSVSNPENAVDAATSNYAELSVTAIGTAALSIKDEISSYSGDIYVGFDIENTSLLSLALLDDVTIRTYLDGSPTGEEFSGVGQLAALDLLSSGITRIGFVTDQEFDEVEIEISALLNVNLGTTRVYNAVIQDFCSTGPGLTTCNEPTTLTSPTYPVYISERTGISGTLNANSEIVNAENVIDGNAGNYAELNFLATINSEISLGVKDQLTDYPAGTFVGFDIENSASILNLELLNSITITTYLNGTQQDAVSGSSLAIGADLLSGSNRRTVGFVASTAVDEVVITLDGDLVGVSLGSTRIYNVIFQCFTAGPGLDACNTYTQPTVPDFPLTISQTGISGAACAGCDILNTNNIIDADLTNFTEMNFTASVGAEMTIGVKDQITDYPAGTFAGFDIENTASLLDAQVLNSITITTYEDGTQRETVSGGNLGLGATLLNGSDRQTVGFVTTLSFDEVVLTLDGGLAGASLGTTRIYSLVLKCFAEGPALACNTNTFMTESDYPVYIDMANTGVDGTLGLNNEISGLSNILDDDTDNYASITQTGGVGSTATITVKKALSPIASGTYVAFDIENPNLLGAELLAGVSVSIYSGGVHVETISSDDLIGISSSILTGTGRQKVGFIASSSFDEARLIIDAGLVGADLGSTRVYGLILQEFCEGPDLDCNELSILYGGPSGHPVIVNGQRTGIDAVGCVGCQINNPDNAIDNNSSSAATISLIGGVVGSADFSVLNAIETYSAGTFAGFDIGTPSLLDADVLDNFTLTTYLDGVQQEQKSIPSGLITAATGLLVNDGREIIGFVTSMDFDEIQITLSKLVSVNVSSFNIYSTIVQRACPGTVDCSQAYQWLTPDFPLVVEGPHTGVDGVASVAGAVLDPWNIINQNTSDFATIAAPVGVLSPASISIKDQISEYPTGTTVGFTVRSANSLLQADLFETISITTYNNGTQVESRSGINLINLDVLVPLLGTGGSAYNVGFVTTAPFDEIQISLGSLASVVNILDVYSSFVDIRTAVDENGDPICPQISMDPDFNVTTVNVPVDGDVHTNDEVPTGTTYGTPIADGGNPGGSSITMNSDGTYSFTASTPGIYEYDVPVCVPGEPTPCPTTRLTITVKDDGDPTSNPPVANTDYGTLPSNGSIELATLANDAPGYPEASLDPFSVIIISGPENGTANVLGTGNITYDPEPGFVGRDSLMYEVCDDSAPPLCATAWQYFTVIPEGSPNSTTAADDFVYLSSGETANGNLGENDTDPEGDSQSITTGSFPQSGVGTLVITNSSGDFTFTPDAGFSGPAQFTYNTCDDGDPQACASATLYVLVDESPVSTVLHPDFNVTLVDVPVDGNVSTNDSIPAGTMYGTPVAAGSNPSIPTTFSMASDGTYTFEASTPGVYQYFVPVCIPDGPTPCPTTRLTITVKDDSDPDSNPPVANTDYGTLLENQTIELASLANDDPGYQGANLVPSSVNIITNPQNGTAMINPLTGNITYEPGNDFVGQDSLLYEVCDDSGTPLCATAWQYFTVLPTGSPNSTTAVDDYITVPASSMGSGNVSDNDNDPEGDTQTVTAQNPTVIGVGTLDLQTNGNFTFTPASGFIGPYDFIYETCDNQGACASATLHVLVEEDALVSKFNPDFNTTYVNVTVDGDVSTNDQPDGSPTYGTPQPVSGNPSGGTLNMNSDGTYDFTTSNPGVYNYEVPVSDNSGSTSRTLQITVLDDNSTTNPPVANPDYGSGPVGDPIVLNSIANDIPGNKNIALDSTSVNITAQPSDGSATVNGSTGEITYTPDPGFTGRDSLEYMVCDDANNCATSWQYFTVTPSGVDNSTDATDDQISTQQGTATNGNVSTNDIDPEGDAQTVTSQNTNIPGKGTLVLNTDGTFTFTPASGFSGPVDFPYTTCETSNPSICASATIHVLVAEGKPDLTVGIQINVAAINEGGTANITYNFSNLGPAATDGSMIEFIIFKANSFGSLTMGSPPSGWTSTDNGSFYSLTSTNVMQVGLINRVVFTATFQHDDQDEDAVINYRTVIINGSGGEINYSNNEDKDPLQIN